MVAGAATAFWLRRRRSEAELWDGADDAGVEEAEPAAAPEPVVPPAPAPPAAAAAAPATAVPATAGGLITTALRPAIELKVQPLAAGLDSLRATLDYRLTVFNTGRAPAYDVTVEAWLFGAGPDPRREVAQMLAQPAGQPLLPPFGVPAAAQADLEGQVVAPREMLATINAGERRLFVPMLVVRASFRDARRGAYVATAAFLAGADRPGQERLAPLALDRGARTWRTLAVRRFDA